MTHPIGQFTTYSPGKLETEDDRILHKIQDLWGANLEKLTDIDLLATINFLSGEVLRTKAKDKFSINNFLAANIKELSEVPKLEVAFLLHVGRLSDSNKLGMIQAIASLLETRLLNNQTN